MNIDNVELDEIIVPSNIKIGQMVVFAGKKYKVIEILDQVHINQFLAYALGEYVDEYGS